jgi:hypothetical protein
MSAERVAIPFALVALLFSCGRTSLLGGMEDSGAPEGSLNSSGSGSDSSSSGSTSSGSGSASGSSGSRSGSGSGTMVTCPPTDGCCGPNGVAAGTSATACGFAGQPCVDCTAIGLDCVPPFSGGGGGGTCGALDAGVEPDGATVCGPANCAGCCTANVCLPGTSPSNCGSHGLACAQCSGSGTTCAAAITGGAACVGSGRGDGGSGVGCAPSSCPGCCDSNGQCQDSLLIGACGTMGFACSFCLPGQACNSGQCQTTPGCGPANCFGCCQGDTCLGGTDQAACGTSGEACQACSSNVCTAVGAKSGGQCESSQGCGPPCGCCSDFWCKPGNTNSYCAGPSDAGVVNPCSTCSGSCATGVCVGTVCNWSNCRGCCMPDGTCWLGGRDSAHCGNSGNLCVNCGDGYACDNQSFPIGPICIVTCSPANCQGCCVGGICSTGTDPSSCGVGGARCVECANGQSCVDGACLTLTRCGATLCAGCCDNDICHTGTSDSECGTGGTACQDCTIDGGTCGAGACSH